MLNDSTYCSEQYEVIEEPGVVHFFLDFLQGTVSETTSKCWPLQYLSPQLRWERHAWFVMD